MAIISSTILATKFGDFAVGYHQFKINYDYESCLSITSGNINKPSVIVRLHSSCLFSESLKSAECDCNLQLEKSLELIAKKGGIIIYLFQEGRGLGLINKMKAMEVERTEKVDTVEAFQRLHFKLDPRNYTVAIKALKELHVSKRIQLITNNPRKSMQLREAGFTIDKTVKVKYRMTNKIKQYLQVKKEKLGHTI